MPATARNFGVQYGSSDAAVRTQIRGQVKYMNYLLNFFNGNVDHALRAYNWGEGNMQNHLRGKRQMPTETRNYVPKITRLSKYYVPVNYFQTTPKRVLLKNCRSFSTGLR